MGGVVFSVETPWLYMDVTQEARQDLLKMRFDKPSGWEFHEADEWSVIFELVDTSSSNGGEPATMTLMVRGSLGKSLTDFSELAADGIKLSHPGSKIVSEQARELFHYPAQQRTFTLPSEGQDKGTLLALMTAIDADIGYLFFYSAQETEFFEKMGAFEEVIKSLSFEKENGLDPLIRRQILAQEYTQAGEWEKAIQELEQLLHLQPGQPQVIDRLAYLYSVAGNEAFVKQGNLTKAELMFNRSLELNGNQPAVKKTLETLKEAK
ncbi:MAG: hypothetical protein HYS56_01865 [Candidatus Omnitrophica bacterium]|nr:hypothetical protein [Candidatus Omnitrophota bacterium]